MPDEKSWAERNAEFLKAGRPDEAETLVMPGDLPPFWKPEREGEEIEGRLIRIRKSKFSPNLEIKTHIGPVSVAISEALKGIDWPGLIGKPIRFTFAGNVQTKNGNMVRQFRVAVLKAAAAEDDEVPF